jgi:MFS family permease
MMSSTPHAPAFSAFRYSDFRWIWTGQLISEAGSNMQLVAINWHIYILTHSPIALGLIGLARVIPSLILSLVGGLYADARDRRKILLVTQSTMMVLAGLLALSDNFGSITVVLIYLIAAGIAATEAFNGPAWQSIVPNLVPREHLMNALSLTNVMKHTATIVGPTIAGFIIAWKGVAAVYFINMVSFIAVLYPIFRMKTPTQISLGKSRISLKAMGEGIHFVRLNKILLSTALLDFFSTFFSSATALLPIFAKDILNVGPQGLGILHAGRSVGAVVSGGAMSFLGNARKKGKIVLYSITVYALATVVFGASHWFILTFLALVMIGAGDTVSAIVRQNIRQEETPDHFRGRMTSVMRIFSNGGPQLGNLEAGIVAALIGAPLSVITGGIANLFFIGWIAWKVPKLREYES